MTTPLIVIPSNPADLKKIADAVREGGDCLLRADAEREQVKAIVESLKEDFPDIDAKYFRRMITDYHKSSFQKKSAENSTYEHLYETVLG